MHRKPKGPLMKWLTAAASVVAAGLLLLMPSLASAATVPLPSCAGSTQCTTTTSEAGYYGAYDGGTRYRFVETTITASPHLVNLDGNNSDSIGAAGVELCNPNTGLAVQVGLWYGNDGAEGTSQYNVSFATPTNGSLMSSADPCIDSGFVTTPITSASELVGKAHLKTSVTGTINAGDQIYLGIYYDPTATHGRHALVIGMYDYTQGWGTQYQQNVPTQEFFEFGIGAVNGNLALTAPANNTVDTFTNDEIACYGCTTHFPISEVHSQGGPYPPGSGLREGQMLNVSSQVVMSPNDSLNMATGNNNGNTFTLSEGSTTS